ncbi:hypothetical protein PMAYCL1PPCAC_20876, partial [Pristionchus mayeri]
MSLCQTFIWESIPSSSSVGGTWWWPEVPGLFSIYVFNLLFYQSFIMLSCFFVYRYVVLLSPTSRLTLLEVKHWIVIGVTCDVVYNAIMIFLLSHYESRNGFDPEAQLVKDMLHYYG